MFFIVLHPPAPGAIADVTGQPPPLDLTPRETLGCCSVFNLGSSAGLDLHTNSFVDCPS